MSGKHCLWQSAGRSLNKNTSINSEAKKLFISHSFLARAVSVRSPAPSNQNFFAADGNSDDTRKASERSVLERQKAHFHFIIPLKTKNKTPVLRLVIRN